jgi:polyribonucleotide nucleotidyltransferase
MVYSGRVVNITKFGAFVNILPGRDGLIHISKLGQGRRIDRVEDVLELGDELEVRVDDIDPQGKVSLSLASSPPETSSGGFPSGASSAGSSGGGSAGGSDAGSGEVSFEDTWEAEAQATFGDLGPGEMVGSRDRGSGDRGPRRNPRRRRP